LSASRRELLKKILYCGVCLAVPQTAVASTLANDNTLLGQSNPQLNCLGGGMYEVDGWVLTLSDLKKIKEEANDL